jgi:hypothetical protein
VTALFDELIACQTLSIYLSAGRYSIGIAIDEEREIPVSQSSTFVAIHACMRACMI